MTPEQLLHQARVALDQSRYDESIAAYEQVLAAAAENWSVRAELAFAYAQARRLEDAERLASQVLAQAPQSGFAWAARGIAQFRRGRHDVAIEPLEQAVTYASGLHPARQALGICYAAVGRREESRREHEAILFQNPLHAEARLSLATADLMEERYREGWLGFECRWPGGTQRPQLPLPLWDGRDLAGQSILIHTEQGLGDTVQLLRLLPLLKTAKHAERVELICEPAVQRLFEASLPGVGWHHLGTQVRVAARCYAALFSLPGLLGLDKSSIPNAVPYLHPEPARVERWRSVIGALPGFKIGVAWQGNPTYPDDSLRSLPLAHFAALAKIPGVTLVSLQKVNGLEQIAANREAVPLTELPGLDADGAFLDTAAVMKHLDLLVASDSAIVHVAGAVAAPAFVPLPLTPDWRWQLHRDDSPWYPTLRLFRQTAYRQWDDVFDRIAAAVRQRMAKSG